MYIFHSSDSTVLLSSANELQVHYQSHHNMQVIPSPEPTSTLRLNDRFVDNCNTTDTAYGGGGGGDTHTMDQNEHYIYITYPSETKRKVMEK